MKIYSVSSMAGEGDGSDDEYFRTKSEALKHFRNQRREWPEEAHTAYEYTIGKIDKNLILRLAAGTGWAEKMTVIADHTPWDDPYQ